MGHSLIKENKKNFKEGIKEYKNFIKKTKPKYKIVENRPSYVSWDSQKNSMVISNFFSPIDKTSLENFNFYNNKIEKIKSFREEKKKKIEYTLQNFQQTQK